MSALCAGESPGVEGKSPGVEAVGGGAGPASSLANRTSVDCLVISQSGWRRDGVRHVGI